MPAINEIQPPRWSTGQQGNEDRDSRTRQAAACDAFLKRYDLDLIATQTIAGQSAYQGEGRRE